MIDKDLGYFLEMVEDLMCTRAESAASSNFWAAVDADLGRGSVPEILDYTYDTSMRILAREIQ